MGKLEGTDPTANEMRRKIEKLQKSLIKKTEEVVEKELDVQANKKLCVELKNILARQPGPEVAEQLSVYQQNLKDKNKQMKALASELNLFHAQVSEYKYEVERVSRESADIKKKYYEGKKKEQLTKRAALEQRAAQKESQQASAYQSQPRFTGGGFNLA